MIIFKQEMVDGLQEAIASQVSVECTSPAMSINNHSILTEKSIAKILQYSEASNTDLNQIDLFPLNSILASTGWNKNDDIFTREELWASRKTPKDKQFNYMHNETDIIGHITGNYVVDFDGSLISDDLDESLIPENFNIATSSVLYKSWSSPELRDRMKKIIAEIEENKWYVSMECLFPTFDYALQDSSGAIKIVKREEATAFLTKHLRAYGGSGEYENYKLGRVLRNLTFSGIGLVTKPANPRSVILNEKTVSEEKNIKEKQMELEQLKAELAQLKTELSKAQDLNSQLKKSLEEKEKEAAKATASELEELKNSVAQKDQAMSSLQEKIDELSKQLDETKAAVESLKGEKEAAEAKVKDMEKKAKCEKRKAQLAEAGLEAAEVEETLASVDGLGDEAFDKIVAMMKKKMKKEDKKEDSYAGDSSATDILDDASEVNKGTASSINEDSDKEGKEQEFRSQASAWFSNCFSTLKNKQQKK